MVFKWQKYTLNLLKQKQDFTGSFNLEVQGGTQPSDGHDQGAWVIQLEILLFTARLFYLPLALFLCSLSFFPDKVVANWSKLALYAKTLDQYLIVLIWDKWLSLI